MVKPVWDDERTTLVTCLACGGHSTISQTKGGRYSKVTCRWCVNGAMTIEQVQAWNRRRKSRRPRS